MSSVVSIKNGNLQHHGELKNTQPLGEILVNAGLISTDQLTLALQNQTIPGYEDFKIGEILSLRGWVKQDTCDFFVVRWPEILQEINASERQKIGFYLLEAHLLTPQQKIKILEIQQHHKALFGQIAATQGFVKQKTVDFFVKQLMASAPTQPMLHEPLPIEQRRIHSPSPLDQAEQYCKAKDFHRAILELRELLIHDEKNAKAHALLARIYQRRQKGSLAKVHLKRAIAIAPQDLFVLDTKKRFLASVVKQNQVANLMSAMPPKGWVAFE